MNYYWFNRKEILQKAKEKYSKEKAAEYYLQNKEAMKKNYNKKYLKAKVREFEGVIKANFLGNGAPKENMHYTCIACITIDSVTKMDKKIIRKFI